MAECGVPVLFSFSSFSRASTVPAGSGHEVLIQKFLSLYGGLIGIHRKFVIQLESPEWGEYIDLPKGFVVTERCKLRLVSLQVPMTSLGNLVASSTVFFCCDMQERFRPAIKYFGDIISVGQRLVQGAHLLGIPVIVTEQYPKGLGSTVAEIDVTTARMVVPKTKFSMVVPVVEDALNEMPGVQSVVLFGVERLARTGSIITTSEAILLQLVADKDHPHFKEIQSLIKASAPESGLLSKV
ncbi:isochorismatase domain-containing protein 1 isoform X2 [Rhincodon typus]|uniref:isochorismatase domain-containing protein 1 isoform X2 n=1 Tax=Rhincodon typus TaxID=259920 RepID=UPI00202E639C|nr:isochorismatase domain-containing protein 1 isoform X2 [Rhincodon typus]